MTALLLYSSSLQKSDLLQPDGVYVVEGGEAEVFVWAGPRSSSSLQQETIRCLTGIDFNMVHGDHVPVLFKEKFRVWKEK